MSPIVTARRRLTAGIAVAALGVGAPTAVASVDYRSPDAKDATSQAAGNGVDFRSPDAKAAGQTAVVATAAPVSASTDTGTSGWVYVGIAGAGVLLIGGAAASTMRFRHRHEHAGHVPAH